MTAVLPNPFIVEEPTPAPERVIEPDMDALFAVITDDDLWNAVQDLAQ
jgi:hypothetical protein